MKRAIWREQRKSAMPMIFPQRSSIPAALRTKGAALIALMIVQAGCAGFFALDMIHDVSKIALQDGWSSHNALELISNFALLAAIAIEGNILRRMVAQAETAALTLRAAQGAMAELLAQRFEEWGFTASEADVARFTIKGFSIAEVADLRGSTEATIKAHLNAVYRKSGVQGRGQLVATFTEELFVAA